MTWRSLIFFEWVAFSAAWGANLAGHVELTGTKTKDLSGVVVWLEPMAEAHAHPEPTQHAVMSQKNKTFLPHLLVVRAGTIVDFPNLDPIFHNAFSSFDGKVFDVGLYPPGKSRSVRFDRAGIVRVFCNIHPAMSAVIVVVNWPWFAETARDGDFQIQSVPEGDYTLHVYHERATESTLAALTREISIRQEHIQVKPISISETGYLPARHKNKYGKDYPHAMVYSETFAVKLSLLWKVLLSISLSLTALFGVTGWLVQNHAIHTTTLSLEAEVQSSLSAYESLWRARKDELASVSLILSTMSDVRAAFGTRDQATIRDTAGELWSKISHRMAIFLVTDPNGVVIASLAGQNGNPVFSGKLGEVEAASASFPGQSSGVLMRDGLLYQVVVTPVYVQSREGPGLINVLVAGFAIDSRFASELKSSTGGSDFVFRDRGRTAATSLSSEVFPPDSLSRVTQLLDLRNQPVGELYILRSFAMAQQRIADLRRQITIVWALAVCVGLVLTWLMFASIRSAREELVRHERIFTIGRLATSIVHDLRNPLAAIYGGSEMLVDQDLPPESVKRLAGNMYRSSRQIQGMLQDLVDVSRGHSPSLEVCRLADVVDAACNALAHDKVEIHREVPGDIELPLERARMERVFSNLLGNAVEAMPGGGEIHIRATRESRSILVEVQDTGPGISGAIQTRLFEPFASAGKKNGLGLGLALSRQTVQAHGGEIWSESKPAQGARFCLRLPR